MKLVLSLLFAGFILTGNLHAAASSSESPAPAKAPAPSPAPASTPAGPETKATPAPNASTTASAPSSAAPAAVPTAAPEPDPAKAPEGVRDMARDFGKKTNDRLAKQKAYLERLKAAKTEEERGKIIAEMRTQQRQQLERQREIARGIRDQLQNSRRDSGVGIAVGP